MTFGLDKKYEQINFEEVSVEELDVISGGYGGWNGLSLGEGSLAMIGIGIGAVAVAPAAAAFALGAGITMLGGALYGAFG